MKKIKFLLAIFLISTVASAQVDFSGSWKLNTSKSKLNPDFTMAPNTTVITQKANDLTIEKHSDFQGEEFVTSDKLTLDGKECINTGFMDSQKKSTVTVSDDKKSMKIVSKIPMNDGGEMIVTEVYKMDGGSLVIESSSSSSYGDMSETMVYDK